MRNLDRVLGEMRGDLDRISETWDYGQVGKDLKVLGESGDDTESFVYKSRVEWAGNHLNSVQTKVMTTYEAGLKSLLEDAANRPGEKLKSDVAKFMRAFLEYSKERLPDWYSSAERVGKITDIKDKTETIMRRYNGDSASR